MPAFPFPSHAFILSRSCRFHGIIRDEKHPIVFSCNVERSGALLLPEPDLSEGGQGDADAFVLAEISPSCNQVVWHQRRLSKTTNCNLLGSRILWWGVSFNCLQYECNHRREDGRFVVSLSSCKVEHTPSRPGHQSQSTVLPYSFSIPSDDKYRSPQKGSPCLTASHVVVWPLPSLLTSHFSLWRRERSWDLKTATSTSSRSQLFLTSVRSTLLYSDQIPRRHKRKSKSESERESVHVCVCCPK